MEEAKNRQENWQQLLSSNKLSVGMGIVGVILLMIGVGEWVSYKSEDSNGVVIEKVDDVSGDGVQSGKKIVVDVGGAVIRPGVYELESGSRLGKAIELAGGLSKEADTDWVSQSMNLAATIEDGAKIYVPLIGDKSETQQGGEIQVKQSSKININSANKSELEGLWGIGESRANTIIESRPYSKIEEVMSKAGLPQNVFDKIKDKISVY